MVNSYIGHKIILKFLRECPFLIKCTIDDQKVECENDIIKKYISKHVKSYDKTIKHISFYIYVATFENEILDTNIHTLVNLPFSLFPVYKKEMDFSTFIQDYIDFSFVDIHAYNTKHFEKVQYDYTNEKSCKSIVDNPYQTNPEIPNFKQSMFHAGNKYQVDRFGKLILQTLFRPTENPQPLQIKYDMNAVINTIDYMFDYLKKGILVGIKDGKIVLFLPMSKDNYKNDYFEELYFDEEDKKDLYKLKSKPNDINLLKKTERTVQKMLHKFRIKQKDVILDRRKWYLNGCLVRNDSYEGTKLVLLLLDFLTELCKARQINDCVFILNTRDFPVLRTDRKHPNNQVVDRMISSKYRKPFCPILSSSTSTEHDDIPFVVHDDWLRVSQRFYPENCDNRYYDVTQKIIPWEQKINKVLFRGSATGCGITPLTNMRLRVVDMAKQRPDILDVGLSGFNHRLKKNINRPLEVLDRTKYSKAQFIDNDTKATYKYILNIDGHVNAFRLGFELQSGSLILLVESEKRIWISSFIEPYKHYVPIKHDLSDLFQIIDWCKANDSECKRITMNAKKLFNERLGKEKIFDYMQEKLNSFALVPTSQKPITINKLCIVLCYRDNDTHSRYREIIQYRYIVSKMLDKRDVNYSMIVVEQKQGEKFNIGKLKNAGFLYVREKEPETDFYVFSDIDMIPDNDLLDYYCTMVDGMAELAHRGTRYDVSRKVFTGGCVAFSKQVFEQINGYSNLFDVGWGGEDDNLLLRCISEKIQFYRPLKGSVIDIEVNDDDSRKKIVDKIKMEKESGNYSMERFELLTKYDLYKEDGLINMLYEITFENYSNKIYHIIVDVKHKEQREQNPQMYDFSDYTDEKYRKTMKIMGTSNNYITEY